VDQVTFRSGLDPVELRRFLDAVASTESGTPQPVLSSPHLSVAALVRESGDAVAVETPAAGADREATARRTPEEAADALSGVWRGIFDARDPDATVLGDIVSTLSHVVGQSSYTILPLAFVKNHDEYTFVHIINVGVLSMSLGEALGFDKAMTHDLGIAALLHDVGKMAVPLEVLNKAGRFTEEEFRMMQVHPVEGARILMGTPGVPDLATIVAYEHHVRYDGGGYPKVPAGWKLNLASRICQIADVYDALRTDRPYRPGMPIDKILKIMRGDSGTYFDPELLNVFLERVVPRTGNEEPSRAVETAAIEA
jgi:HD-GYP domain-containing protein (c-di-GMP phosphodiesterase class II)